MKPQRPRRPRPHPPLCASLRALVWFGLPRAVLPARQVPTPAAPALDVSVTFGSSTADLGPKTSTAPPTAETALSYLRRIQKTVSGLERKLSAMRLRLSKAEREAVKASQSAPSIRRDLFKVKNIQDENLKALGSMSEADAQQNSTMGQAELDLKRLENGDFVQAADKMAHTAERYIGDGQVKSRTGICLNAAEREKKGGKVDMWTCLGQGNQQWVYDDLIGQLKSRKGLCLDAVAAGSPVNMWNCHSSRPGQQWSYNDTTGLIKSKSGVCLLASQPGTKGSSVLAVQCDKSTAGQQWKLTPGSLFMKIKLEAMQNDIWTASDPTKEAGAKKMLERLEKVEKSADSVSENVTVEVKAVLPRRLRRGMRQAREALRRMGESLDTGVRIGGAGGTEARPTEPPLGEDLGLG